MAALTIYNNTNIDDAFIPMFTAVANNSSSAAYTADVISTAWTAVATIGNIVVNGTFTGSAAGWTLGAGGGTPDWYYSANAIFHANGGGTNTLVPNPSLAIVAGNTYEVTFTTTRTAGSVRVSLGGVLGTLRSTAATFTETITAINSDNLAFVPLTTFVGSVDTVIVRLQNWNSVCYGNKQIVAVAKQSRTIATSHNGSTWTDRVDALPSTENWQSVTFGNGTFVAVANGTTPTAISTDGITWTSGGAMPAASAWYCVTYGNPSSTANGIFVAVPNTAGAVAAVSTDKGVTWSSASNTLPSGNWRTVTYGNGYFVAISYNSTTAARSTDGVTWSSITLDNTRNWTSVTYGNPSNTTNGIFLAVAADSSKGIVSVNKGETWSEISIAPNLVFNGGFVDSSDGWTLGAGWSYAAGQVTHTSGTTTVVPVPALSIATATKYEVTFTVSGRNAGSVTMSVGGAGVTARSTNDTFTEVITTTGTGNLTFTPTTDFDGSIDDISVRLNATWNCVSYGEVSGQGRKVFTVTGSLTANTLVSYDAYNWFGKTIISALAWNYHCFAPIAWNSADTLTITNNATVTVNTNQTKYWKTITATYGTLSIQNLTGTTLNSAINFYMGRNTAATINSINLGSGVFTVDIDGNWIELGTGDGTADQEFTTSFTEYVPSLWVETGSSTGVYEIWNNISGAIGPYMKINGKDGLEWAGSGKRGNYFEQRPSANPVAVITTSATGVTTAYSYYVSFTSNARNTVTSSATIVLTFSASTRTIVQSGSGAVDWGTDNYAVGDILTITGGANAGTYTVYAISSLTLTVNEAFVTDETADDDPVVVVNGVFPTIFPGAFISGTGIVTDSAVNRVVSVTSTTVTLELNLIPISTNTGSTFTIINPVQSQWSSTVVFGDGTHGNVVPTGAKVRQPNIMFSDLTSARYIVADFAVCASITLNAGGVLTAQTCLFGRVYPIFNQAATLYLRNIGFDYKMMLNECYAVDIDGIGTAAGPMVWYNNGTKWLCSDSRYGRGAPTGYTGSTTINDIAMTYIHNAVIKNWHYVTYNTYNILNTGTGTLLYPFALSYTDDATFENWRIVVLNEIRAVRALIIANRVYRTSFTNMEFYGTNPLTITTSDNNTFTNIEYSVSLNGMIKSFKTGQRLSEDGTGTLMTDGVPYYFKTRSYFSWFYRTSYFDSGEYSCTPFQSGWLFPENLSMRPNELVPSMVTIDWTRRTPEAATVLTYEIHRSTSTITSYTTSTAVFRVASNATITFANGPRDTETSVATTSYFVFTASNKRVTLTGSSVGSFTAGNAFVVGDVIDIAGTTLNDGAYTIATVNTAYLALNEAVNNETCGDGPTVTGRAPVVDTKYYYRMRKFHSITNKPDCVGTSGSNTLTLTNPACANGALSFDNLYSLAEFYFTSGSYVIHNRKMTTLFALPFYVGALITGDGIDTNTRIVSIDAPGREIKIDKPTTQAGVNVTIILPVQTGMAVVASTNKPDAGITYGTTVVSRDSSTQITLSNNLTADLCTVSVVNGSFATDSDWTKGAGWSWSSGKMTHASGTATLTPAVALVAEIGKTYSITYTISGHIGSASNSVTASFGGVNGTSRAGNGVWQEIIVATSTATLAFTPLTGFIASIENVTIGVPVSILPYTESPEYVVTPHDYTSAKNFCQYSSVLNNAPWVKSNCTITTNSYMSPDAALADITGCAILASNNNATVTQNITGLSISSVYSASIWVRADQNLAVATNNGVAGSLTWGTVTTTFVANEGWQKINAYNFTATDTSHDIVITVNTSGQTLMVGSVMVALGTSTTACVVTAAAQTTLKPCAQAITTLSAFAKNSLMTGSSGHQGVVVTLPTAPTGVIRSEIHVSTVSGFTPSDATRVADTWAVDLAPILLSGSNSNNFSNITKLPGGGSASAAAAGLFSVSASSSDNAFVNVDIDYTYQNTTAIPALHLTTPAQNNVFHNVNFGRVANMLTASVPNLWHSTAANSVTGNRLQNIVAKHYDIGFNDQSLNSKVKGITGGNAFPTGAATAYVLGTNVNDDINVAKAQCYGSMFNEFYFGNGENIVVNPSFTENATGWTLGSGWTYGSNKVTHTSGTATVVPNPALTIVATKIYVVTYTIAGCTTGSVTASIGGVNGTARSTNGTFIENITATGTGNLTFTPTTGFDGSIDETSVNLYNNNGALHVVFEDTQGVKPYTLHGNAKFDNTGKLFMAETTDYIEITWPWKIKGVTGFRDRMPRLLGTDFGNNAPTLDGLAIKYKVNNYATWKDLTAAELMGEGTLDATNGFDFALQIKPKLFMKFSTQVVGTYITHTVATPGVITIGGAPTWAVGQKVLYTTTGTALGGLTNGTEYFIASSNTSPTTIITLADTSGGTAKALTGDLGTGVHTFQVLFQVGETVKGATSFATGVVSEVYYDSTTTGTLVFSSVSGSWVPAEVIRTNDLDAIKATNVVTNTSFALGPSFTSNINALQIATTVDQTKKYDAAIVTVTLQNIVPGSIYYIYNTNTFAQIATGTVSGTLDPGETTLNFAVSVVFEEEFDIRVNVRKSTAPVKYLPYETGSTVTSAGASVFIAQIVDTVVIDSYGAIASDWTVYEAHKRIKHTGGTTIYSVNALYSYLLDYFDNAGFLDDEVPISASTPTEYKLINGWYLDNTSTQFLTGGSLTSDDWNQNIYVLTMSATPTNPVDGDIGKTVQNTGATHTGMLLDFTTTAPFKWYIRKILGTFSAEAVTITLSGTGAGTIESVATGETTWSNVFTLGSLVSATTLDVYQQDTKITRWWPEFGGHIDILVKVKEAEVLIDSGNLTILARDYTTYGSLYDHFVITAPSGRNPVPLAAFADGNNQTSPATVAAYSGITFDFGYVTKNMGSGDKPYDVIIECNNHSIQHIYEYLKYVTRSGSTTTFPGYGSIVGEYYTGVGDVHFAYDNESGTFIEGQLINGSAGNYGYLVSVKSNPSGFMTLRNVHGTFTNNMSLTQTPSGATAQVDTTNTPIEIITSQKQAPFGTFAGGQFFGARGVFLEHVAPVDTNNYQLIDSTGTTQIPPTSISLTITDLLVGDRVGVFRADGDSNVVDKNVYTSHNTVNTSAATTFTVTTSIATDTPDSGSLYVVDRDDVTGHIIDEFIYPYLSWTGSVFTLDSVALGRDFNDHDTAFVPYISEQAAATSVSVSIKYVAGRYVTVRVRKKGIIPFIIKSPISSNGLSISAIRTTDINVGSVPVGIATDYAPNCFLKQIIHTGGTTVYTVNNLYSLLMDIHEEIEHLTHDLPMSAQTPSEYTVSYGWYIDESALTYLKGGAITTTGWDATVNNDGIRILTFAADPLTDSADINQEVIYAAGGPSDSATLIDYDNTTFKWWIRVDSTDDVFSNTTFAVRINGTGHGGTLAEASETGDDQFSNIYTLGTIQTGTDIYVYQDDVKINSWWPSGQIDIVIETKENGVLIDSGKLYVIARKYGTLYDHFIIDATTGRNPVPLASFIDTNNQTLEATVATYSNITFTFGSTSKDILNGNGAQPYDCIVNCSNRTVRQVYEYCKYITRAGSIVSLNGVNGEYYTGVGDIRLNYTDLTSGPFVEGGAIISSSGGRGYIVSLIDDGSTGTLLIRNVHGNFLPTDTITSGSVSATIYGTPEILSPSKQAPFGTFAGGKFFGARGVWLDNVASADKNNYQLTDSLGATQSAPAFVTISVSGLDVDDVVSVFRTTGNNKIIDKTYLVSDASLNTTDSTTFTVVDDIPTDTPTTGIIRIVDTSENVEHRYSYTSYSGKVFSGLAKLFGNLSAGLSQDYVSADTAYVPFIDIISTSDTTSVSFSFVTERYLYAIVRHKGIVPFDVKGQLISTGYSLTAIRTTDSIVS